jgi:cytoplasmic iron level regulating protein YaaA (DUF328/UPF0246 family)
MVVLLSSAKTLDFESPWRAPQTSPPEFLDDARPLIAALRARTPAQLGKLLGVNPKLAALNADRNRRFAFPFTERNARPALFAYQGDVYRPLHEDRYTSAQLRFAHRTIRILSGLFGVVRALDLIQPYRLEMAAPLAGPSWRDLYEYWRPRITPAIDRDARGSVVVNLASREYAEAVDASRLTAPTLTVTFKETRGGGPPKVIGILAKRARGQMADFIIQHQLEQPEGLKRFTVDGYAFAPAASTNAEWVFIRRGSA